MKKSLCVVITSAGRRTELIELVRSSAEELGYCARIVAADREPRWSAACSVADAVYAVPSASSSDYLDAISDIVAREKADLLIPTIDPELLPIARGVEEGLFAQRRVHVVSHSVGFVQLCRDKRSTMRFLREQGVRVPQEYSLADLVERTADVHWPVIAKPWDGSASAGLRIFGQLTDDLRRLDHERYLVQEYLPGDEYTVNAYVSRSGKLLASIPHRRCSIRGGEVQNGVVEPLYGSQQIATQLAAAGVGIAGPFCFQCKVNADGDPFVFEINARIGGGYPLAHRAGGVFTTWMIREFLGETIEELIEPEYGWKMLRCDRSFFSREPHVCQTGNAALSSSTLTIPCTANTTTSSPASSKRAAS